MARRWRVAGIDFSHMHMGDLLRQASEHPDVDIVGVYDRDREKMRPAQEAFGIPDEAVYTDLEACLEGCRPDLVLVCAATADHAATTERVARPGVDIMVEKPFATNVAEADRMTAAAARSGSRLAINWPMTWYPGIRTAKRLIDEGAIGRLTEVHYYNGNRGPLYHLADKVEVDEATVAAAKPNSWWYKRASGGGSLLDYMGYGATLGTWFMDGRAPSEVTCVTDQPNGLEVDEHAVAVLKYDTGLSKLETRWGTFTDSWKMQPQPKCGFVLVGTDGTISCYDFEQTIGLQTRAAPQTRQVPVDAPAAPYRNPIEYLVDRLGSGQPIEGPLDPALCRIGQRIIDAAVRSAAEGRSVKLSD
jgi:glucose-fructose oxidoreductase